VTSLDWASASARFGLYASLIFLFGVMAFRVIFAPGALGSAVAEGFRGWTLLAAVVVVVSIAAFLPLLAGSITGDWSGAVDDVTLSALLATPNIGFVWFVRINLAGLLLIWLYFQPAGGVGPFLVAALLLASLALSGHAMMREGLLGWFHLANHVVHILSASLWLGSLPPLLACLKASRREACRAEAMAALKRFSWLGHIAVACVLVTGTVNVWLILGQWPLDWTSLYQILLAAKIALVALMAGTALINRYVFTPRIGMDAEAALKSIARGTVVEIMLGAGVLALVAMFGLLEPV
jgi:copper resistance protein D